MRLRKRDEEYFYKLLRSMTFEEVKALVRALNRVNEEIYRYNLSREIDDVEDSKDRDRDVV